MLADALPRRAGRRRPEHLLVPAPPYAATGALAPAHGRGFGRGRRFGLGLGDVSQRLLEQGLLARIHSHRPELEGELFGVIGVAPQRPRDALRRGVPAGHAEPAAPHVLRELGPVLGPGRRELAPQRRHQQGLVGHLDVLDEVVAQTALRER